MERVRGEIKSVLRHLPEILVMLREAAQPGVLKLPGSPEIAQVAAFAGKEFLGPRKNGPGVKDRKSVKGDRFNVEFWSRRRGQSGCRQSCGSAPGQKFPAIYGHNRFLEFLWR